MNRSNKALFVGLIGLALICLGLCLLVQRQLAQGRKNRELVAAIRKGEVDRAIALVESGADPNCPVDNDTPPPTVWQVVRQIFSFQLKKPAEHDTAFSLANSTLFERMGIKWIPDSEMARLDEVMLRHGANVRVRTRDGFGSSLMSAIVFNRPLTARVLIEHGADVSGGVYKKSLWNIYIRGQITPLMYAIICDDVPIAILLLQHNADVNIVGYEGKTALCIVAHDDRYLPLARELLKHKADVNHREENGDTPLTIAQKYEAWSMVKLLKEAGAKQ